MRPDPVGGDAAQRAARAELHRAEYRHDQPGLVTRVLHWVGDKLGALTGGGGGHALLLLLALVAVVVLVLAIRAGRPRRPVATRDAGGSDPLAPDAARDHRRRAAQHEAEGRRDEALREWLRAAVSTIADRGVLPPRPGRTGADTAREAGAQLPSAAADLARATRAFDEVWFGARPATDDDVAAARAAADAVLAARVRSSDPATDAGFAVPQ